MPRRTRPRPSCSARSWCARSEHPSEALDDRRRAPSLAGSGVKVHAGSARGRAVDDAPGFLGELKAGWRFLRGEPVLLANTLQAAVAQLTVGVLLALTPVYAEEVFGGGQPGWQAVYAFIETGVGAGNLLGGFLIGLVGMRFAKGQMVIAGYTFFGLAIAFLALSGNLGLAIGFAFGSGIANMLFVIPSQTLFQERTPPELMGRVVGFRFALVFGAMTLAMALGGVLAELIGVTVVLAAFGLVTMATGLVGLFVPAVRDADTYVVSPSGSTSGASVSANPRAHDWVHWRPRPATTDRPPRPE